MSKTYDPIPDLAHLLCAAQRQGELGEVTPGVAFAELKLRGALGLPELAYRDEAEAAIRRALSLVAAQDSTGTEKQQ